MSAERFRQQLAFIEEIDKVKHVLRQTILMDGSRRENDAEHAWHLGVMAMTFEEYAAEPVDLLRVCRMLLIHDLVEIDAGDTFAYDTAGNADKREREEAAADRIFAILPADQAADIRALWEEFEAMDTPESRYAAALDRFQPLYHNFRTEGHAWRQHGIRRDQVIARNRHIAAGAPALWEHVQWMIDEAVSRGWLAP